MNEHTPMTLGEIRMKSLETWSRAQAIREQMPRTLATQREAIDVLEGELDYQVTKWTPEQTATAGRHENVAEWLMYIEDYVDEAKHVLSRQAEPGATTLALHTLRKIAALAVSGMMNCGALTRAEEGPRPVGYTA